jgi:hypothetical protein
VKAITLALGVAIIFGAGCQIEQGPAPQSPAEPAKTAQEFSPRDPNQGEPESIPATGEIRIPIFSDPTPDQLVYLDQPDPDEALVQQLLPGAAWWCFYGTHPENNNRTSYCERTMAKCDQHSSFMVTARTVPSSEDCILQNVFDARQTQLRLLSHGV